MSLHGCPSEAQNLARGLRDQSSGPRDVDFLKVPLDGGVPVTLADAQNAPVGIAVDATSVYWTNSGCSDMGRPCSSGSVMKVTPK